MCVVSTAVTMADDDAEFDDENMCSPGTQLLLMSRRY